VSQRRAMRGSDAVSESSRHAPHAVAGVEMCGLQIVNAAEDRPRWCSQAVGTLGITMRKRQDAASTNVARDAKRPSCSRAKKVDEMAGRVTAFWSIVPDRNVGVLASNSGEFRYLANPKSEIPNPKSPQCPTTVRSNAGRSCCST